MEVTRSSLLDFIAMPDTRFTIPRYQRRYSWQERQCQELWLDIHRAATRDEGHFSGTILYDEVVQPDADSSSTELSIVDGQQRITTLMLMLAALRNHMMEHPEHVTEGISPGDIDSLYLKGDDGKGKLIPSRLDGPSMQLAIEGAPPSKIPSQNISRNLGYFEELMEDDSFNPTTFLRGLGKLAVVKAKVGKDDDAQAVFESLNSKGMQLNIADMVRNYLLSGENHEDQTRLYIEYWTVIEGVFDPDPGSLKLDNMVKAWLSVRFPKVRARTPEDVYSAFKRYYDDEYAGDLEPVLNELRSFSMVWAENYRYHAVKKFKSMPWATLGAQTLPSGYELKKADNEEYAERVRRELRAMDRFM